ncbi:G-protein coupled receptor Mth [Armadillidium vulgare]|nr:G-protein coupled receptor Mth [Armadillidium vulgare]
MYQIGKKKFCRCDSLCKVFNDCCQVPISTDEGFLLPSLEPKKIACTQLLPSIHKQAQYNPAAYMVNGCMNNSSLLLVEKCSGAPKTQGVYSYLLDIPVISNVTGIMYKNIFCAACNKEAKLRSLKGLMSCNTKPEGSLLHFIKKVKYIPGSLTWQSDENACVLQIQYGEENIRWCEKNIVENCSISWNEDGIENNSDISHNCSYITAYVESDTTIYKNSYCAMCNNENPSSLRCFKDKEIEFIFEYNIPINGLYEPSELCDDNHFWDPVYEVCLPSIGELMNGSVKINKIKSPFEEANFKLSCRTTIRKHSFSVLYPNGTIYLRKSRLYFHSGEYEVMDSKWIKICVPSDYWTTPMKILSLLLLTISMICLALHMIIFLLLPKRRNIPSMNLFSLSFALFISELIYACFFNYQSLTILCQVSAILLYYFLSSAFIWMNVMSIDICRTFRSSTYKIKSKKVFVQYSLYAWILPVFPTTIVIAVDKFASKDFILIPDLGSETCWFNNIWGHAFFFTIPAGLIVLINMVLYGFSVWGIYTQHKLGKLAAASVQQNEKKKQIKTPSIKSTCTDIHSPTNKTIMSMPSSDFVKAVAGVVSVPLSSLSNSSPSVTDLTSTKYMKEKNNSCSLKGRLFRETENFFQDKIRDSIQKKMKMNKKNRIRLILYSKLALIMGMTWIFAFLSIHTQSILLEYLFIIFNGCQGTVIFFSFDCKKIIWKELKEKFGWKISKDIDVSLNEKKASRSRNEIDLNDNLLKKTHLKSISDNFTNWIIKKKSNINCLKLENFVTVKEIFLLTKNIVL